MTRRAFALLLPAFVACRETGHSAESPATAPISTVSVEPVVAEDGGAPALTGDDVDASAADAGAAADAAERIAACRRCCDDEDTRCSVACQQERGCLIRCGSRRVACRSRCPAAPPPCDDLDAGS